MTHEELINTQEYQLALVQTALCDDVVSYMTSHNMTYKCLARHLGITRKRLKILLDGDYDGRISEYINIQRMLKQEPKAHSKTIN